jgi:hypothetical protein
MPAIAYSAETLPSGSPPPLILLSSGRNGNSPECQRGASASRATAASTRSSLPVSAIRTNPFPASP